MYISLTGEEVHVEERPGRREPEGRRHSDSVLTITINYN